MKVAIIYKYIPQYRVPFFNKLKDRLKQMGIDLLLIYGQPGSSDSKKKDAVELDWAKPVKNIIISIKGRELYWQPVLPLLNEVDLVIVEQANKLLINNLLIFLNSLGYKKLAFWGHGRNFQANGSNRFSESIKSILATKVHWWFPYNELSADIVRGFGFPNNRISIVQNAIDTGELIEGLEALRPEDLEKVSKELGLKGKHVCLYVGGMYPDKGLRFLLDACLRIKSQVPDFEMIFIGSGSDAYLVQDQAKTNPWIHYIGSCFGKEKIPYFAVSSLFLLPRAVGLAVLDSFALELPLVTTNVSNHGPEIEYLKSGFNGWMVNEPDDPQVYARAVIDLLLDDDQRKKLVEGCRSSKKLYTVEEMVDRFALGVQRALQA